MAEKEVWKSQMEQGALNAVPKYKDLNLWANGSQPFQQQRPFVIGLFSAQPQEPTSGV